ncbi:MAG: 2'-5' RNA ligase family protein [Ferruginibacter sp.]
MKLPLIVTLQLEKPAADFFSLQRKTYFPAHINYLDAHLTLFHVLPSGETIIKKTIESICQRNEFNLEVTGIKNIGNGVAYNIESQELSAMHLNMQKEFDSFLTGKDRGKLWPHITIQNKVTAFKALTLYQKLSSEFKPFSVKATGISTWKYLDGPWEHVEDFSFTRI